jgi:hypothetical protein
MKLFYGMVFVAGVVAGVAAWSRRGQPRALLQTTNPGAPKGVNQPSDVWPHGGMAPYGDPPRRLHS